MLAILRRERNATIGASVELEFFLPLIFTCRV